ncbi:unnamed protein product [Adineta steineri]|uniref:Uncharacterized protein n=1 Tax=Adineta steineri TaxID=433720 RepID=A0A815FZJ6_9BILA|nr:unnamed protein product [Adineta steineri]CAF1331890.1 unnamed protein product [Adineta steineri]
MLRTFCLLLLFIIQFNLNICEIPSINKSNCSLTFQIQTIYQSNKIQTDFPIEFIGTYNLTCSLNNLTAYYKITPLAILVVGKYKIEQENFKSMVELYTSKFKFSINQSSTIRLCILSNDDDNDDDNDHEHRICRQIHIGINTLYTFWTLPMKILYFSLPCLISTYYFVYALINNWCKHETKPKSTFASTNYKFLRKNETFEHEKVHEDMSVEE